MTCKLPQRRTSNEILKASQLETPPSKAAQNRATTFNQSSRNLPFPILLFCISPLALLIIGMALSFGTPSGNRRSFAETVLHAVSRKQPAEIILYFIVHHEQLRIIAKISRAKEDVLPLRAKLDD